MTVKGHPMTVKALVLRDTGSKKTRLGFNPNLGTTTRRVATPIETRVAATTLPLLADFAGDQCAP